MALVEFTIWNEDMNLESAMKDLDDPGHHELEECWKSWRPDECCCGKHATSALSYGFCIRIDTECVVHGVIARRLLAENKRALSGLVQTLVDERNRWDDES